MDWVVSTYARLLHGSCPSLQPRSKVSGSSITRKEVLCSFCFTASLPFLGGSDGILRVAMVWFDESAALIKGY